MRTTDKEVRQTTTPISLRKGDGERVTLEGYALKFNKASETLGRAVRFKEKLSPNCLQETDMTKTVALINHDPNQPLGRTGANLELSVDDVGLRFALTPVDTSYARDLITNIEAGIVDKCSFGFTVPDEKGAQKWERAKDSKILNRTINKIEKIYDVSIVTEPAYDDTSVVISARSMEVIESLEKNPTADEIKKLDIEAKYLTEC